MSKKLESFYRGDDFTMDLTIRDNEGFRVDLTNCTVFFTIKENKTDSDDEAILATDDGGGGNNEGETKIEISSTESDIDPGTYYYDFQLVDSNNKVATLLSGTVEVLHDITKRTT